MSKIFVTAQLNVTDKEVGEPTSTPLSVPAGTETFDRLMAAVDGDAKHAGDGPVAMGVAFPATGAGAASTGQVGSISRLMRRMALNVCHVRVISHALRFIRCSPWGTSTL